MPGPLHGIKVLDASAVVSGPFAAMILADQGADVVKIEAPGYGDVLRAGVQRSDGLTAFYTNCNRGKRAIQLDVYQPEGRDVVLRMAQDADVFIQNFRPGAVERLGIAEPDLRAVNPDLIYVSITGYGSSGPYKNRRVYDPVIQGLTGFVATQVNPEVPIPDLVRNIVCDKSTSWTAAQAITSALFARERGAGGQHLQIAMLEAALYFFWPDGMLAHTLLDGDHPPGATLYEIYRLTETADGHLIYFVASDPEFHGLFRALGHPEWIEDERFSVLENRRKTANREILGPLIVKSFAEWETEEILERLIAEEVPCGPVHSIESMVEDPQLGHLGTVRVREHPSAGRIREVLPPARFDKTPTEAGRLAPLLGEHTDEVLAEYGVSGEEIAALREKGVIPATDA